MRIRPVVLDSHPRFLAAHGPSSSLLMAPFGADTVLSYLRGLLAPITRDVPLVLSPVADPQYASWIHAACADAKVATTATQLVDEVATYELSDALLVVDSRCIPLGVDNLQRLVLHHTSEPRLSHHLVVFESGVAGTKERVSLDASGQVRKILRHYDPATWSFISGVTAMMVPVASGILSDGTMPATLTELRQTMALRGVPGRDVPITGGTLDLQEEAGLLAANEIAVRRATRGARPGSAVIFVGDSHRIHSSAQLTGPLVIHSGAQIAEGVRIVGPAVIGARAEIGADAVLVHSVVGANSLVPSSTLVRNRMWCATEESDERRADAPDFGAQLARAMAEVRSHDAAPHIESLSPARTGNRFMKRALDVAISSSALLLLSPILALVALAVWLESRSPIFYGDKREGLGGRTFRCWKFRTMFVGAHAAQKDLKGLDQMDGPHFKVDHDPRVTRVGRVLRALNLDELPQLFNVLVGEMSLVGPRPSPFRENQVCVPWREARLSVRPGITGFWQVCRHDRSNGDFHQWIEYDLLYVQHISFVLDLKILAATFATLGGKMGSVSASWLVRSAFADAAPSPSLAWRSPTSSERASKEPSVEAPVRRAS